ncbi:prepilin-type N-terminal cleavage/methylation domain-containing protein [Candidatus Microgenomates bacterium]|nr:prepilin-type N-terminal cleavage/methylation domain-containing protein [Candidatus Microgenomates bacterium]
MLRSQGSPNQRGDTLIEVIIATVIIGMILFTAYTLGSKAFQLGQLAKERNQASQIIQGQAEALRALRDKSVNWDSFKLALATVTGGGRFRDFHMLPVSNQWLPALGGAWDPQDGGLAAVDGRYRVTIKGGYYASNTGNRYPSSAYATGNAADMLSVAIEAKWDPIGDGPEEVSTLYFRLTDTEIF